MYTALHIYVYIANIFFSLKTFLYFRVHISAYLSYKLKFLYEYICYMVDGARSLASTPVKGFYRR